MFAPDEADREAFHIALLELRTQGPFNERIREQLARSDRLLRGTVADILADGIEAGVFCDVDVEETAALLVATLDGARTRQITLAGAERDGEGTGYTREVAEATGLAVFDTGFAYHLTSPSVSKGAGLTTLAEGLGLSTDEFVAVGDSENDASMLRIVDRAVAVANADERAKETASHVTEAAYADGFLEAVDWLTA